MSGQSLRKQDLEDVQKFIVAGYGGLKTACYLFFPRIKDVKKARSHITDLILPMVDSAADISKPGSSGNRGVCKAVIAFSHAGLETFLGEEAKLRNFDTAFREGMAGLDNARRARILGDVKDNAPEHWDWGKENEIELLVILFSDSEKLLDKLVKDTVTEANNYVKDNVLIQKCYLKEDSTEHFGFRDGISQPRIKSIHQDIGSNLIKPGEFILGYENESGVIDGVPEVKENKRWGRNGTYLVVRKIEQHVNRFNNLSDKNQAKAVGRWPSGAPLVFAPSKDNAAYGTENNFGYHGLDQYGHKCPIGAHIRRANPRDSLILQLRGKSPVEAMRGTRARRIIRRGRLYDEKISGKERKGLMFACINASIEDQFEFVQHQWIVNDKFGGLDGETDPLIGLGGRFTVKTPHACERLAIEQYTTVRAGGYFFMPGINALKDLLGISR